MKAISLQIYLIVIDVEDKEYKTHPSPNALRTM